MINIRHYSDRWTQSEQAQFLLNLSLCLDQGFPLYEAILLQQAEARPAVKKRIHTMIQQLELGHPVPKVFHDLKFPREVTVFLHFTNQAGLLSEGFQSAGILLKKQNERKARIQQLLRYPLFLFWILGVMGYIIIRHLLPNFNTLYTSMALSLPPLSHLILSISLKLPVILTGVMGLSLLLLIGSWLLNKRLSIEKRLLILVKLPVISYLVRLRLTSHFATHFGSLLSVGMPINQALHLMSEQTYHPFLQAEAEYITKQLNEGSSLPSVFAARPFYTRDFPTVIQNGAGNARLGLMLSDYSNILFKTFEERTTRYMMLIQPICFFLFGGFILTMFLSILLPMFDLIKGL